MIDFSSSMEKSNTNTHSRSNIFLHQLLESSSGYNSILIQHVADLAEAAVYLIQINGTTTTLICGNSFFTSDLDTLIRDFPSKRLLLFLDNPLSYSLLVSVSEKCEYACANIVALDNCRLRTLWQILIGQPFDHSSFWEIFGIPTISDEPIFLQTLCWQTFVQKVQSISQDSMILPESSTFRDYWKDPSLTAATPSPLWVNRLGGFPDSWQPVLQIIKACATLEKLSNLGNSSSHTKRTVVSISYPNANQPQSLAANVTNLLLSQYRFDEWVQWIETEADSVSNDPHCEAFLAVRDAIHGNPHPMIEWAADQNRPEWVTRTAHYCRQAGVFPTSLQLFERAHSISPSNDLAKELAIAYACIDDWNSALALAHRTRMDLSLIGCIRYSQYLMHSKICPCPQPEQLFSLITHPDEAIPTVSELILALTGYALQQDWNSYSKIFNSQAARFFEQAYQVVAVFFIRLLASGGLQQVDIQQAVTMIDQIPLDLEPTPSSRGPFLVALALASKFDLFQIYVDRWINRQSVFEMGLPEIHSLYYTSIALTLAGQIEQGKLLREKVRPFAPIATYYESRIDMEDPPQSPYL